MPTLQDEALADRISNDPRMPKVGERVSDRYVITRLIGEGGFAAVYEAEDTVAGGMAALKVLDPEKSIKPRFAARFRQEVLLVRQLRHPNTIKVWDFGNTESGCLFFAMECLVGHSLEQLIEESGGMEPARAVPIVIQVLKSLVEAHGEGIIHRDLKPANIMICDVVGEDDFVKVLDFGIAKALAPDLSTVKTQTGFFMCTPAYAAPELLRGQEVTPAADVYAVGLILAEMVAGIRLVGAGSPFEVVSWQLSPEPFTLPEVLLSSPLKEVLLRATNKDVGQRYETGAEMLHALRELSGAVNSPGWAPNSPGASSTHEPEVVVPDHQPLPTMVGGVGAGKPGQNTKVELSRDRVEMGPATEELIGRLSKTRFFSFPVAVIGAIIVVGVLALILNSVVWEDASSVSSSYDQDTGYDTPSGDATEGAAGAESEASTVDGSSAVSLSEADLGTGSETVVDGVDNSEPDMGATEDIDLTQDSADVTVVLEPERRRRPERARVEPEGIGREETGSGDDDEPVGEEEPGSIFDGIPTRRLGGE